MMENKNDELNKESSNKADDASADSSSNAKLKDNSEQRGETINNNDRSNDVNNNPTQSDAPASVRKSTLVRLFYVIIFAVLYAVAEVVFTAIVVFQFGFKFITDEENEKLLEFSIGINKYIYQILQYMTFLSDEKPFPFSGWPE